MANEVLITRMKEGDSSAFSEFYDRYAPRVLGLLVRLLPTRTDADDVLQEVFWQVWRTADRYDSQRANPRTWLFMMARSRAVDFLRKKSPVGAVAMQQEPAGGEDPTGEIEREEWGERVQGALLQLSGEQEQAIRLSFYDGFAHKDIAERLRIPLGTAKTRIRSGMHRLRDLLAEKETSDPSVTKGVAR